MTSRSNRLNHCSLRSRLVACAAVLFCGSTLIAGPKDGAVSSDAAGAKTASVPEAVQKILNAAVKAMGGRDAINEIDAMHTQMEMTADMGSMTIEHWWQKPNKSHTRQSIPQMGEMTSGSDGAVWWRHNPIMGYQIISEEDASGPGGFLAEILDVEKSVKEDFTALEAPGAVDFDGRKCDRIRGQNKDRPGTTVLYFDASTGLPAGAEMVEEGPRGQQRSKMYLRDWKAVDTIKLFHTMDFTAGPQSAKATVQLIEFNNVAATKFHLPAEVKAMAAAQPKKEKTDDAGDESLDDFDAQQRVTIETILQSIQHVNDPNALREMVGNLTRGLDYMPPRQKEAMEYAIGKIEERITELGG